MCVNLGTLKQIARGRRCGINFFQVVILDDLDKDEEAGVYLSMTLFDESYNGQHPIEVPNEVQETIVDACRKSLKMQRSFLQVGEV